MEELIKVPLRIETVENSYYKVERDLNELRDLLRRSSMRIIPRDDLAPGEKERSKGMEFLSPEFIIAIGSLPMLTELAKVLKKWIEVSTGRVIKIKFGESEIELPYSVKNQENVLMVIRSFISLMKPDRKEEETAKEILAALPTRDT